MNPSAHEELKEFKLFYRSENNDLSVMLLYTLILLMEDENYFSKDFLLGERGAKDYIDNCFFCGCLPDKSGRKISYFILQDINLYNLYNKAKVNIEDDIKEAYIEAIIISILEKVLTTLRKENGKGYECMLFYINRDANNLMILDKNNINDLKHSYKKKYSKEVENQDDLAAIHSTLKGKYKKIRIYLTLNGDIKPQIPQNIVKDFEFCTKTDRGNREACRTKTYVRDHIISNERKYKKIYDFVRLPFPK